MLKAQAGMMEYLLMSVFMLIIIIVMVFFVFGWSFGNAGANTQQNKFNQILFLVNRFSHSDFTTKEPLVLDDSKLMKLECNDIEEIFGSKMCISISKVLLVGELQERCTTGNYPDCNSWIICEEYCLGDELIGYDIPVGIYRRIYEKTEIGLLDIKVGEV